MNPKPRILSAVTQRLLVGVCAVMLVPGDSLADIEYASLPQDKASTSQNQGAKIPADQLDSLVAPIALYPDPMLAQVLAVSTIRWRSFSSTMGNPEMISLECLERGSGKLLSPGEAGPGSLPISEPPFSGS